MKRKLIGTLIFLTLSGAEAVVAQTTATGPNLVYIQQVGSSNTITIEQVGGTNRIGGVTNTTTTAIDASGITTLTPAAPSATNYGTITGSTNLLAMNQYGNNNSGQYNIRGGHTTYNSTVTGNDNQTALTIGDQNHSTNDYNVINETITGDTNLVITNIVGGYNSLTTSITGSTNQITQNINTSHGVVNNTVSGNNNVFNIQQTDMAGANGHNLVLNTSGNYNSITTQQQGTNDTTFNVNTNGNNNTITIRSSSSAIVGPMTAIAR